MTILNKSLIFIDNLPVMLMERPFLDRTLQLAVAYLFFIGLSYIYIVDISTYWNHRGFLYDFSFGSLLVSICLIFIYSFSISRNLTVVDSLLLVALYMHFIPSLVLFSLGDAGTYYICMVTLGYVLVFVFSKIKMFPPTIGNLSGEWLLRGCLAITVSIISLMLAFGAYKYFNLNILKVYEYRAVTAKNLPTIFGYILSPVSKIILPLSIVLCINYKKYFLLLFSVFLTIVFFGLTHHKSVLFASFFVVLIYFLLSRVRTIRVFDLLFLFIVLLAVVEVVSRQYFGYGDKEVPGELVSIIIRRAFFIPPLLDQFYLDFFTNNELYYWASSKVSVGLIDSPYLVTAPKLIAREYFDAKDMSSNTGFIGSGYANLGVYGMAIYSIMVGITLSFLQAHGKRLGHVFVIIISFILVYALLMSSDFLTVSLTHGLWFLFLSLTVMKENILNR